MEKIILSTNHNEKSIEWTKYAIDSFLAHNVPDVKLYVLSDIPFSYKDVTNIVMSDYEKMLGLDKFTNTTKYFDGSRFPIATFYRLAIPLINEFQENEKVIYTDADVECISPKFFTLFNHPMQGNEIVGVVDNGSKGIKQWVKDGERSLIRRLLVKYGTYERLMVHHKPILAGTILMSPRTILQNHSEYRKEIQEVINLVQNQSLLNDQAVMNIYFKCGTCSSAYNSVYGLIDPHSEAYLIHYAGSAKTRGEYPPKSIRSVMLEQNRDVEFKNDTITQKTSKGSVWDKFDYVALMAYTGYIDRCAEMRKELKRIGLWDRVHIHWDFPDVFTEKIENQIALTPWVKNLKGSFSILQSIYEILSTAYNLGCSNLLLMQDDVRFIKDIRVLEDAIKGIPHDYDLIMFDRGRANQLEENRWVELHKGLDGNKIKYVPFTFLSSDGCYAMSRRTIRKYLDVLEGMVKANKALPASDLLLNSECLGEDKKLYMALPNVAVQSIVGRKGSHCNLRTYWSRLMAAGVQQELYNMPFPVITQSNFLDLLQKKLDSQRHPSVTPITVGAFGNAFSMHKNKVIEIVDKSSQMDEKKLYDRSYIWGNGSTPQNMNALQIAYRDNAKIILGEEGFIRSVDTWCGNSSEEFKQSYAVVFDSNAYYFEATRISTVEQMLNDFNLVITPEQRVEARRLINKIVSNKVSKYNHQPIYTPKIGREGVRKVLVVDQSYGDFSVKRGMADDSTFEKMLNAAIKENPDADIIVKTHPDTLAGKKAEKKGYYQDLVEHDNIYKVTFPINPYSLMEICDKVYVCSSQFGFEALMAGKEVHVFGMPFYAGWGLTIDDQHLDRRANMRTLEEVFYIFYLMYTHWVDPDKGCETTIDFVIDKMIELREKMGKGNSKTSATKQVQRLSQRGTESRSKQKKFNEILGNAILVRENKPKRKSGWHW